MDANKPITAGLFSAFLKCPTKAYLMATGECVPSAYFADIEARISSTYKENANQRPPIGTEVAELLDFGKLSKNLDYATRTKYVDCDTVVYDFVSSTYRPERC